MIPTKENRGTTKEFQKLSFFFFFKKALHIINEKDVAINTNKESWGQVLNEQATTIEQVFLEKNSFSFFNFVAGRKKNRQENIPTGNTSNRSVP